MKKTQILFGLCVIAGMSLPAQDIKVDINGRSGKPALAVVDLRGAGDAQPLMAAFNSTLFSDLQGSALFDMKPKSMFPLKNPQQPADLVAQDSGAGMALPDWSGAPVNASHLVFGYTAITNGVLVLYGYVYDARQPNPQQAQLMFDRPSESPADEAGAIRLAHKFATDIIQKFGGASLLGSRIYFVSNRGATGQFGSEIWVMDWDGNNQRQLTFLKGQIASLAVSTDGSRLAFTIWRGGSQPQIAMVSTENGRPIPFYNQQASLNAAANFTPDGMGIYYSSTAGGTAQIYRAHIDGGGFTRITSTRGTPTEPKVNPKNPSQLLFVDGPGPEQIYRMNSEGSGIERVTNGEGEASNPAWSPDGQQMAFAWTRGYASGKFNIFVMNLATGQYTQLTHADNGGEGKNENPVWAPDGAHLVYQSTPRSGRAQIFSIRADGNEVKQLTTQGTNKYPVWGVK